MSIKLLIILGLILAFSHGLPISKVQSTEWQEEAIGNNRDDAFNSESSYNNKVASSRPETFSSSFLQKVGKMNNKNPNTFQSLAQLSANTVNYIKRAFLSIKKAVIEESDPTARGIVVILISVFIVLSCCFSLKYLLYYAKRSKLMLNKLEKMRRRHIDEVNAYNEPVRPA